MATPSGWGASPTTRIERSGPRSHSRFDPGGCRRAKDQSLVSPTLLLALSLASSSTLRLTRVDDVIQETALAVAQAAAIAVGHATAQPSAVDDPTWPDCGDDDRCAAQIRSRAQVDDVVFLQLDGSATLIRVTARRVDSDGKIKEERLDLPREVVSWKASLDELATRLFGKAARAPEPLVSASPPPPGPRIAPWVLMGAGAASLGVGIVFGVMRNSTESQARTEVLFPGGPLDPYEDQVRTQAIVADVLFGVAGASVLTGLGLLIFGD